MPDRKRPPFFDNRSLKRQIFWFMIAIVAMNVFTFFVFGNPFGGPGLWLLAPPLQNVGSPLSMLLDAPSSDEPASSDAA